MADKRGFFMKRLYPIILIAAAIIGAAVISNQSISGSDQPSKSTIELPKPKYDSNISIEKALFERRSTREYKDQPLNLTDLSQLLWAAQGITDPSGLRTAPSAGALYPLKVYVVVGDVINISDGIYRYDPEDHVLLRVAEGDRRKELYEAALRQESIRDGEMVIVLSAIYETTTSKYGERGIMYVHMEAGHTAQNICLQAVSLNLGVVTVGAFSDELVKEVMEMPVEEHPLYLIPVGRI
jgi:SagB-type dehydrogenase family enzyme